MKQLNLFLTFAFLSLCASCSKQSNDIPEVTIDKTKVMLWDFKSLNGWLLGNQDEDYPQGKDKETYAKAVSDSYAKDGWALKIWTKAHTEQRKKQKTVHRYGAGIYTWRTYIPPMETGAWASIGSFLYNSEGHEIDFEVGSGDAKRRKKLGAKEGQVVVFMTSQNNPWAQNAEVLIDSDQWHTFQIKLTINPQNNHYIATWLIDGVQHLQKELNYGQQYPFRIFCSVENIDFIGDHIPTKDHYALWDYVMYEPFTNAIEPVNPDNE